MATSINRSTSISGNTSISGYTSLSAVIPHKHTYNLFGEDITVEGYLDSYVAQNITLINCIGWKYYEEIQKQGVNFRDDLKVIIDQRYKSYLRDKKITNILD